MKTIFIIFFSCLFTTSFANTFMYDSVGIEEVDGKKYILHKVEMKETLYSVSRKYNVSIYKIIESNPPTEYGLEVGQVIKIPYLRKEEKKSVEIARVEEKVQAEPAKKPTQQIYHTVVPKETLFAISRQYEVSVSDLKKWNNLKSNNLDIGQRLIVKQGTTDVKQSSSEKGDEIKPSVDAQSKTHIVKQSETLYSISRMYGVSVADIKSWNDLPSNEIGIGQELVVGQSHDGQKQVVINEKMAQRNEEKTSRMDSALMARNNQKNKKSIKEDATKTMETSSDFGEVIEAGVAALIEGSDNTRKYLALHRTAKVGTIMRVHNEMNGQEVFVRVLGKLPDTGVNKNVVIRISKSAYDRLGAIDPKFRVKLSYIP